MRGPSSPVRVRVLLLELIHRPPQMPQIDVSYVLAAWCCWVSISAYLAAWTANSGKDAKMLNDFSTVAVLHADCLLYGRVNFWVGRVSGRHTTGFCRYSLGCP